MTKIVESDPDNRQFEDYLEVIPRVGEVMVLRREVPILEHTSGMRGRQCLGELGMEVEFPQGKGTTIVCSKCYVGGMIAVAEG